MEQVILVDAKDNAIGVMEKMKAHEDAVLHRAFSIFIFNRYGEMLLQQRAPEKYHSAGLWTNTCCSHPRPGEETIDAANRRLQEEMGFTTPLTEVFDFIYKASFENGLTEHEFDHVFVGHHDKAVHPDPAEVQGYAHYSMQDIQQMLQQQPQMFTAWFHIAFPKVYRWWRQQPENNN